MLQLTVTQPQGKQSEPVTELVKSSIFRCWQLADSLTKLGLSKIAHEFMAASTSRLHERSDHEIRRSSG